MRNGLSFGHEMSEYMKIESATAHRVSDEENICHQKKVRLAIKLVLDALFSEDGNL